MQATEQLKHDHRVIERLLIVLDAASEQLEQGRDPPPGFFPGAVDFIRNFADRCHHAKEEEYLFPALAQSGMSRDSGPIGVMLREHRQAREYVRGLDGASQRLANQDRSGAAGTLDNARKYATLLRSHINKEDNILFPMADQLLSVADQKELYEQFEEIEEKRLGPGAHENYVHKLEDWEHTFGLVSHANH